jgi:cobalt-zinc-cadmium efflux system membrane fusion protein
MKTHLFSAPLCSGAFAAALLLLVLSWGCGGKPENPAPGPAASEVNPEAASSETSDLDRQVADLKAAVCEHAIPTYTCGECRYEVGVVKVPDEMFKAEIGGALQTVKVGSRALSPGKDLNGEIRLNEERSVYLSPVAPGVVRSIRIDLGGRAERGQVLYEVDSPEFRQAKADYCRAASSLDLARSTEQRESELFSRKISPKKDLLEAQAALRAAEADQHAASNLLLSMGLSTTALDVLASGGDPSGLMPVRAPFSGTVLERSLSLGALVQPGDRALLLADTSKIWVLTTLYESELAALLNAPADEPVTAEVTVTAYPGRLFKGTVEKVGGTLDESTRATTARVVVENPDNLLRSGMFARVRLSMGGGDGLALPEEAILEDEGRSFVFVHMTGPYYIRRPVKLGKASAGWIAVTEGVSPEDIVVAKGAFLLKSDVLRSKMGAGCAD